VKLQFNLSFFASEVVVYNKKGGFYPKIGVTSIGDVSTRGMERGKSTVKLNNNMDEDSEELQPANDHISNSNNNNNNNSNNNDHNNTTTATQEISETEQEITERVYLHKIILASRSRPLKEICVKSKNNVIFCEDIFWKTPTVNRSCDFDIEERKIIMDLLQYLYTFEFSLPSDFNLDNLLMIFNFATAFEIADLKELVTFELLENSESKGKSSKALSPEVCFQILQNFPLDILSDELKRFCIKKIKNSRSELCNKSLFIETLPDYVLKELSKLG
jgi:hypothetical protein